MSNVCQNCGKEVTTRNKHHFQTFLEKPLCRKWKPCYYRKTGKSFRQRKLPTNAPGLSKKSIEDFHVATRRYWSDKKKETELIGDHKKGAHAHSFWNRCPECIERSNRQANEVYEDVLRGR